MQKIGKISKKEYELVPEKQKMRTIAKKTQQGTLYKNGSIYKESMSKLVTKDYSFTYNNLYNFCQNIYLMVHLIHKVQLQFQFHLCIHYYI